MNTSLATREQIEALETLEVRATPVGSLYGQAGFVPHAPQSRHLATGASLFAEQRRLAKLDFHVEAVPLFMDGRDNGFIPAGKHKAIRNAQDLTVFCVGTSYKPVQFDSIDETLGMLVDAGIGSADGVLRLRNGAVGIGRVRLDKTIRIPGDDSPINAHFQVVVPHDKSMGWSALASTVRAVCENTMRAALKDSKGRGSLIKIKHTTNAQQRVDAVREALRAASQRFAQFESVATRMAQTKMSDHQMMSAVNALLPEPKNGITPRLEKARTTLMDLWAGKAQGMTPSMRGTAWGAYNAFTEYADHWTTVRGEDTAERRVDRALFGRSDQLKQEAFQIIEDVVGELV